MQYFQKYQKQKYLKVHWKFFLKQAIHIFFGVATGLTRFLSSPYSSQLSNRMRYILEARVNFLRKIRPEKRETVQVAWNVKFSHKIFDDLKLNSLTALRICLKQG